MTPKQAFKKITGPGNYQYYDHVSGRWRCRCTERSRCVGAHTSDCPAEVVRKALQDFERLKQIIRLRKLCADGVKYLDLGVEMNTICKESEASDDT